MLAAAGYPNGLTLTTCPQLRQPPGRRAVGAGRPQACGVKTKIVPVSQGDYYGKYLNSPSATKAGTWDISEPGWVADWYGNNGRVLDRCRCSTAARTGPDRRLRRLQQPDGQRDSSTRR